MSHHQKERKSSFTKYEVNKRAIHIQELVPIIELANKHVLSVNKLRFQGSYTENLFEKFRKLPRKAYAVESFYSKIVGAMILVLLRKDSIMDELLALSSNFSELFFRALGDYDHF